MRESTAIELLVSDQIMSWHDALAFWSAIFRKVVVHAVIVKRPAQQCSGKPGTVPQTLGQMVVFRKGGFDVQYSVLYCA